MLLLFLFALAPPDDAARFLDEWQRDPARARALAPAAETAADQVELWLLAQEPAKARDALPDDAPLLEALIAAHEKQAAPARAALERAEGAPLDQLQLTTARVHAALGESEAAIEAYEVAAAVATNHRIRASAYCELTELLFADEDPAKRARVSAFLDACRTLAPHSARMPEFELEFITHNPDTLSQKTRAQLEVLTPRLATISQHGPAHSLAMRRLVDLQLFEGDEAAGTATLAATLARYGDDAHAVCDLAFAAALRYERGYAADGARATDLLARCLELSPDEPDAASYRNSILLHRARPWLIGGCILLLAVGLVVRSRRAARVKG